MEKEPTFLLLSVFLVQRLDVDSEGAKRQTARHMSQFTTLGSLTDTPSAQLQLYAATAGKKNVSPYFGRSLGLSNPASIKRLLCAE